jgi:hypothetical protein
MHLLKSIQYMCIHTCICTFTFVRTYTNTCICTYVHTYTHSYIPCLHTCMHTYNTIHTYTHSCTHMQYIHTYIQKHASGYFNSTCTIHIQTNRQVVHRAARARPRGPSTSQADCLKKMAAQPTQQQQMYHLPNFSIGFSCE